MMLLICSHLLAAVCGAFVAWLYFCFAACVEQRQAEEFSRAFCDRVAKDLKNE